jgi:CheY-like chemotaxis protein
VVKRRVLFVDDDLAVLSALRRLFWVRRTKWDMVFVAEPAAALAELGLAPFDVVVCDLQMPHMQGDELLRLVGERSPHTKRILLSGSVADLDVHSFADCLLTKPCAGDVLAQAIEAI